MGGNNNSNNQGHHHHDRSDTASTTSSNPGSNNNAAAAAANNAAAAAAAANTDPSSLSPSELKSLLRTWCDAVEKPITKPVEELGPEKRVEFDVRPRTAGLANPPPPMLNHVPGLVNKVLSLIKITKPTLQEHECGALTAFSGNSMVIFAEWRLIITTPQRVHIVRYLLRLLSILYEAGYETEWASFVRKNNDSPWTSKDKQVAREFSVLKTIFPTGRSYIFGAVDQDHYFYYIYDDVKRARQNNFTPALSSAVLEKIGGGSTTSNNNKNNTNDASTTPGEEQQSASGAAGTAQGISATKNSPERENHVSSTPSSPPISPNPTTTATTGNNNNNTILPGGLEAGGRRVVEDNVQFNVKMYNIKPLEGTEETLKRLGLEGLALDKTYTKTPTPSPQNMANVPAAAGANVSITAGGLRARNDPQNASATSITTQDLANNNNKSSDQLDSFPTSPVTQRTEDPSVAAASVNTALGEEASAATASNKNPNSGEIVDQHPDHHSNVREHSERGDNETPTNEMSSRHQSEMEPGNNTNTKLPASSLPSSPPNVADDSAVRPIQTNKNADELAVEVIKQASRFVLPDQYETLRLLRDIKQSHQAIDDAPRYVATYETTIDNLEDTKNGLINLIEEFQPERFTIIALCDPESPASRALKQKQPIGVEQSNYTGYNLINRTMNRFAWGYQVLSFSYIRIGVDEIIPHSPPVVVSTTPGSGNNQHLNNVVSKGKS